MQVARDKLIELQKTVLQEQLSLIRAQDMLLKQQQELNIEQQNQRHAEEMKLLVLKQEIATLKLQMLKQNKRP